MRVGNLKHILIFIILSFLISLPVFSESEIKSVPLINLEELSPTFEEDKDELEQADLIKSNLEESKEVDDMDREKKDDTIYINLRALDKITAKTSEIRLAVGEKNFFGPLEIKALKCQFYENEGATDTVAYLQVKDLSMKDNNQVFLFNGWTFASSPTLKSIDHPVYDLWITSCENI
jgi:hypothetical protein